MLEFAQKLRLHLLVLRQRRLEEAPAYIWGAFQTIVTKVKRKGVQLSYMIRLRLKMPAIMRNEQAIHHRAAAPLSAWPL